MYPEKVSVIQWHTQNGNITTNHKVKVDFTLTALSATNFGTWKFHVDDSTKGRYNMILGKYILSELWFNLKLSQHVSEAGYGPFKGSKIHMVDLCVYVFKYSNTGEITPEELFTDAYAENIYEP